MASKLYVGSLSFDVTEEELKTFFQQIGSVESVAVITDKFDGRSKGFGFVEMSSPEDARRAIAELNGKTLGGRSIKVDEARPSGSGGRSGGSSSGRGRW